MPEANYVLNLPIVDPMPPVGCGWCNAIGVGSPEGSISRPQGSSYVNTSNGDVYFKSSGGTGPTGWVLVTGGGGGGTIQVYEGRDPALPDDPTEAAFSFPVNGGTVTQWSVALQAWV